MPFEDKVRDIINHADEYHTKFYKAAKFGGPSLHFHQRALGTRNGADFEAHLEHVYAMLVSWGMNRMGGGPKMLEFEPFRASMVAVKSDIEVLRGKGVGDLARADSTEWARLETIFRTITVMRTSVRLIAHSKVLAHALPDIVAPIDREYVLTYLNGHTNVPAGIQREWDLFKSVHVNFVLPLTASAEFRSRANGWLNDSRYAWDTSVPKIIDNLVIGCGSHIG
jgi:hypothetical protein